MAATAEHASPWLKGRSFASLKEEVDRGGYLIFERVLAPDRVAEIRAALGPHLARERLGRSDSQRPKTHRLYAPLTQWTVFAAPVIRRHAMTCFEAEPG